MKWITVWVFMREFRGTQHLEVVCDMRLTGEAWRNTRFGIPDRSRELRHNIEACERLAEGL
jgi:hypothetical protein